MGFYRYTEEDLTSDPWDVLNQLDQGSQHNINHVLKSRLTEYLHFTIDCESPIERMLAIAMYDLKRYWATLSDDGEININTQSEIKCCKKTYRVDFLVSAMVNGKEKKAVIECDGHEFHEKTKEQANRDRQRERDLTKNGYTVVRFTGSEIYNDIHRCIVDIKEIIFSG